METAGEPSAVSTASKIVLGTVGLAVALALATVVNYALV